jgi:ubiquinone/menaquinone biosynthesis C-methylase UbiE
MHDNASEYASLKSAAQQTWTANPAGWTYGGGAAPGTKEFFDNVLAKRSTEEQPWLFDLVPFATFRGKQVLELGCGAGYDAYAFCKNGADYTGIDLTPDNPLRTRTHLSFYGLEPKTLVGDAEQLMFPNASFDAAFSNGVLHHTPDMRQSFCEIQRVLKPGGDFWVILYHKDSIFHWLNVWLYGYILRGGFLKYSYRERLSMIEYTSSGARPLVNLYRRHEVAALLEQTGFQVDQICVRKLVWKDMPGPGFLHRLYQLIPQGWYDQLGKFFGWYIIAHAHKR